MDNTSSTEPISYENPWRIWPTIGFTILIFLVNIIISVAIIICIAVITKQDNPNIDLKTSIHKISEIGSYECVSYILSAIFCVPLIILCAKLKKGISIREYLALRMPNKQSYLIWLPITFIYIALTDGAKAFFNIPTIDESSRQLYDTTGFKPLFYITVILAAPIYEEFLMRGFLFASILRTRIKSNGAILITSALWAILHVQYGYLDCFIIFVAGMIIGTARVKSSSLIVCIAMHVFGNLIFTIELLLFA